MADCELTDIGCHAQDLVGGAIGSAIESMATAVMEAVGKATASLGTLWVHIGTPNLTGGDTKSAIKAGRSDPNSDNLVTVLGYVTWISFVVAAISLVLLGVVIATRLRQGEGLAAVGRLGLVLGGVVLISAASAMVSSLLPAGPSGNGGTVFFLQSALWWYMALGAVVSLVLGGARMAWEQRAEPGRDTLRSLLTLIVVAGAGVTTVGLLVAAADSFSVWLLEGSLDCQVDKSTCFGDNLIRLLALSQQTGTSGLGALLVIILGLIAVLASVFQIVLMIARGGMLVILTGVLPLAASATNTEMGKHWFRKCLSWLVAFILYKPAAAIVYATAFQLAGAKVWQDDGSGLVAVLTGLALMVLALVALPALMRFVTPMVGALAAGGGGGVLAAAALAALPTGAAAVGRLAGSGGGSSGESTGGRGSDGASGAATSGPSGPPGTGGTAPGGASSPAGGGQAASRASGASSGGRSAAATSSGAATPSGSGAAAAGGGPAAGGAGAGATAGGAAAAGAAGGPVGLAAGAAIDAAKGAGSAALGAARKVGEESTGEGSGPDGSR